jgi:NAD(P)-dependent dehydrogenase (short-subunit alcohol dehydrogenase family)
LAIATDVSRFNDIESLATRTVQELGGIDTWVNNSGGSIYGRILDVPIEEERKLFEVNYWGVVYGSRVAANHLRTKGGGHNKRWQRRIRSGHVPTGLLLQRWVREVGATDPSMRRVGECNCRHLGADAFSM